MGSLERRQREAEETRVRILDAARDLFVSNGYEATSMRAIAKRIEYTPTAIYHHFHSKEDLLCELCALDFRALSSAFQQIGRVDDPIERIDRIGEAYTDFALGHPQHYSLMFMAVRPAPSEDEMSVSRGDPSEDAYAFLREAVAEALAEGRFRAEFVEPDQVAQILWGSLHGIISLYISKSHDEWVDFGDVQETAGRMRQVVLRGLQR